MDPLNQENTAISTKTGIQISAPSPSNLAFAVTNPAASYRTNLAIFSIVLGTILATFTAPALLIPGALLIVIGTTIPLIWPEEKEVIKLTSQDISLIVGDAIEELVLINANDTARELANQCDGLNSALKEWIDSGKTQGAAQVRTLYYNLAKNYPGEMIHLIRGRFRHILLPMYVNAGWNYLSTLRAIYGYANELGLNSNAYLSSSEMVLNEIKIHSATFTDQALDSFHFGLEEIIRNSNNPDLKEKRPTWVEYNHFRNTTTISAMDFVASFPYFNPENYPGNIRPQIYNRRLYTCLVTKPDMEWRTRMHDITDIRTLDKRFNQPEPVYRIDNIEFRYGLALHNNALVDGLVYIICRVRSVDGSDIMYALLGTGDPNIVSKTIVFSLDKHDIYVCEGDYVTEMQYPVKEEIYRLIHKFSFYLALEEGIRLQEFTFYDDPKTPYNRATFQEAIPPVDPDHPETKNTADQFTHRLANISMVDLASHPHPSYLFTWHHKSIIENAAIGLPPQNASPLLIYQFHAVAAANNIRRYNMEIVAGPSFTGGDLLMLKEGQECLFYLTQLDTWQSGFYKVRIWYVRTQTAQLISVSCYPNGNLPSSHIEESVPAAERDADLENLKYEDLAAHTFQHTLLLTRTMKLAGISVTNESISTPPVYLVLDRIEFIFDRSASDPV